MTVSAKAPKTVLMVAGEFSPMKTIGRLRTLKFVEHLCDHNWQPIVLTIEPRAWVPTYDSSLESEIPEALPVYRAPWPDLEAEVIGKTKRLLSALHGARRTAPTNAMSASTGALDDRGQMVVPSPVGRSVYSPTEVATRLFKAACRQWVFVPDDYVTWARNAYRLALTICAKHPIDVVYTTLPPFSASLIGYRLKRELGLPWVVDYRDLWYGDVLREWIGPIRRRLELVLERRYMRQADVIIAVSEQKTRYLKALHPRASARWETLTNGYDSSLYEPLLAEPRHSNDTIDFTYTGRLFKNRRGYAFAEALGQLAAQQPELKSRVRVHILGHVSPEIRARYDQILSAYAIQEIYRFTGDVSHQEAMRAQVNTDYLLLIVDTGKTSDGVIGGKLFEYIAARRPIFALADPGASREIIEQGGLGRVVPAESVEKCKAALSALLSEDVPETLSRNEAYLEQFDRRAVSARLATLLNDLLAVSTDRRLSSHTRSINHRS